MALDLNPTCGNLCDKLQILHIDTTILKCLLVQYVKFGVFWFIYLFGVLRHFQHCTGHITTGSWKGRGNQYIQFARVVYCKLPTNGKQLPAFPLKAMTGIEPRPQRWEARVLPLCHRGLESSGSRYVFSLTSLKIRESILIVSK